jgi:hypothetical protein
MPVKLFVSHGSFELASRYTADGVTKALTSPSAPPVIVFDLMHGGTVRLHVGETGEWAIADYGSA